MTLPDPAMPPATPVAPPALPAVSPSGPISPSLAAAVVYGLVLVALSAIAGSIYLSAVGRPVPDFLISMGSMSVGGLITLLARASWDRAVNGYANRVEI